MNKAVQSQITAAAKAILAKGIQLTEMSQGYELLFTILGSAFVPTRNGNASIELEDGKLPIVVIFPDNADINPEQEYDVYHFTSQSSTTGEDIQNYRAIPAGTEFSKDVFTTFADRKNDEGMALPEWDFESDSNKLPNFVGLEKEADVEVNEVA